MKKVNPQTSAGSELSLGDIYRSVNAALDLSVPALSESFNKSNVSDNQQILFACMTEGINSSKFKDKHACRAGCSACCSQLIPVTAFEAIVIAEHLEKLPEQLLNELCDKLALQAEQLDTPSARKFGPPRVPCAFLSEEGACTIHPIRPIRCRGFFSSSAEACGKQVTEPSLSVPVDGHALAWSRGVQSALAQVLEDENLDSTYYELQAAVLTVLRNKETKTLWIDSKPAFENCLKAQSHPQIIWVAPQSEHETVVLARSENKLPGQRIDIKTFYE